MKEKLGLTLALLAPVCPLTLAFLIYRGIDIPLLAPLLLGCFLAPILSLAGYRLLPPGAVKDDAKTLTYVSLAAQGAAFLFFVFRFVNG